MKRIKIIKILKQLKIEKRLIKRIMYIIKII